MMLLEWEKAIDKKLISKDGELIGRVTAILEDYIIVTSGEGGNLGTYMIPKSRVKVSRSKSELMLNMHFLLVDKFKV